MRGHQSGAKGMQAEMPAFSREIEAIGSFDSASRCQLRFIFGRDKRGRSRCGGRGATAGGRRVEDAAPYRGIRRVEDAAPYRCIWRVEDAAPYQLED